MLVKKDQLSSDKLSPHGSHGKRYVWQLQLCALTIGAIAAGLMVRQIDQVHENNVKELMLGQLGSTADKVDKAVLCTDLNQPASQACIDAAAASDDQKILWLGNSQLPTINQWQSGDRTMVAMLHEAFSPLGYYVFGCAPPNANLQEHLVITQYLIPRLRPRVLLLPVFYDDLRETSVREQLSIAFSDSGTEAKLRESDIGRLLCDEHASHAKSTTPTPTASESTLDWSELQLNKILESQIPYWSRRGTYRSVIFVNLYLLRNTVFGIKADSIRRMIPSRMERNLSALKELFSLAQREDIKVLVYIPPIRSDVPIPYDMQAYELFKRDLQRMTEETGFAFAILDNEVPSDDWGTKDSTSIGGGQEIDFMHFSVRGHRRLASALEKLLTENKFVD